jgi:protein phosphatase
VRALLLSDIHGNIDALDALQSHLETTGWSPDAIVVLGDLVDYGPEPADVVGWVQQNASVVVCGNHDFAMATGGDCRSSARFKPFAVATREWFRPRLGEPMCRWLAHLPRTCRLSSPGSWLLAHATPRDPLFEYLSGSAPDAEWRDAIGDSLMATDAILVGHSHEPFVRRLDDRWIVNPGSLGLPKDGDPRASYATWEDGTFVLHRIAYDVERAVARLLALDLPPAITQPLTTVLRTGSVASLDH